MRYTAPVKRYFRGRWRCCLCHDQQSRWRWQLRDYLRPQRHRWNSNLSRVGLFDTGGLGGLAGGLTTFPGGFPNDVFATPNDALLASQNSLISSESKRCLFASNTGSDRITPFRVNTNGRLLEREGIYPSGGNFPISVTQRGNTVYALNAGGEAIPIWRPSLYFESPRRNHSFHEECQFQSAVLFVGSRSSIFHS